VLAGSNLLLARTAEPRTMYAVATYRVRLALNLDILAALPAAALALALLAWATTFAGLLRHAGRLLGRTTRLWSTRSPNRRLRG
jgi:hypothetical protein